LSSCLSSVDCFGCGPRPRIEFVMAVFSRRDIQASLNNLGRALTRSQLAEFVHRLNGAAAGSLSAEWEAVILSAFSQCGRIQYEKDFGGKRKPDLFFQLGSSGNLEFLADITTVSDTAAHDANPYDEFYEAVRRFLKKRGHNSAGLYLDVRNEQIGEYGDRKVRLLLPRKGELDQFVRAELGAFLSEVAKRPDKDARFSYNQSGICFSLQYNSKETKFSEGHAIAYTVPYSKRRNPLANTLNEKGNQLANSGYKGPSGIIVCDGGCDALNERPCVSGMTDCREIVSGIFQKRSSILFVLVLRVEQQYRGFIGSSSIQIVPRFYWNSRREKVLAEKITIAVDRMLRFLPCPESTPGNAIRWLINDKNVGRPLGGITMQGKSIKISARALTELLAGRVDLKRFLENHYLKPVQEGRGSFPFFELQLNSGHTLKNAFVEGDGHKDDDWIVLEYDGPDPAISPFRVPS